MTSPHDQAPADVADKLGLRDDIRRRWILRSILFVLLAGALAFLLLWWRGRKEAEQAVHYETQPVTRGSLVETVSATGTLAPVNEVEVGSEVSGTMKTVEADYNDAVTNGQVLARIDTSKLEAQALQSEAALEAARAKVVEADATVKEAESQLTRLGRVRELSGGKVPSQFEFEGQEASLARAKAGVASARAEVARAQATLDLTRSDLTKAIIHSPVNGVVLSRQIEPGQTVAANFEAPVLFKLAENLAQLELQVDVDEADVGRVREGQDATFTVDAYPDKRFPAVIRQVRYGSKTTEGVVTYTTVLKVSNEDLSLRPGMTATAVITTRKAENALLIPSAALRFEPPQAPSEAAAGPKKSVLSSLLPHPPRPMKSNGGRKPSHEPTVYVLQAGQPRPMPVATGLTDGAQTEVKGSALEEGMEIITGLGTEKK